jgi:hypothetical protein
MTCSADVPLNFADVDIGGELANAAARLCGQPVTAMKRQAGGGNNCLYRVETLERTLALKSYGPMNGDWQNDRLAVEFRALSFLSQYQMEMVPAAIAVDPEARLALYDWIDGTPPVRGPANRPTDAIDSLIAFIGNLQKLRGREGATALGPAAEACFDAVELHRQIRVRLDALAAISEEAALGDFLIDDLAPALDQAWSRLCRLYMQDGLAPEQPLNADLRILSPSDFGFHNALCRPDGRFAFLDFEYFGWDDPVKLLADSLWHPAFRLSATEQQRWLDGLGSLLAANDPGLFSRLRACLPLYGLRWCTILLNEFRPERWERRRRAGTAALWPAAKATQLRKARAWLVEVRRVLALPDMISLMDALPLAPESQSG